MRSPSRVNRDNIPGRRTHQAVERIASSAGPPMEERGREARASRANEATDHGEWLPWLEAELGCPRGDNDRQNVK
jgi:hypothetical protein